jgi:hypothetical protein
MTRAEVRTACAALEAAGRPITIDTVHAHLGYGIRSMVRQHLARLGAQAVRTTVDRQSAAALRQYRGRPMDMRTTLPDREEEAARLDTLIAARRAALPPPRAIPQQEDAGDEDAAPEPKEAKRRQADLRRARSLLDEAVPWLRT